MYHSSSCVRLSTFYTLIDTRVLNSFEELCIMRVVALNSFARVLNSHGGAFIYIYIYIYIYLSPWAECNRRFNMFEFRVFLFLTKCHTNLKEPHLPYYLPIIRRRTVGFISFPSSLVLCDMQTTSSRIWTCIYFLLSVYIYKHMFVYIYIYIYICVCVCVCVYDIYVYI